MLRRGRLLPGPSPRLSAPYALLVGGALGLSFLAACSARLGTTPDPTAARPASSPTPTPPPAVAGPPRLVLLAQEPLADPGVYQHGTWHYLFGTSKKFLRTRTFKPDDVEWFEMNVEFGEEGKGAFDFWAFRVYRHTDGSFHAYAAVHYPWFRTVIGHFVPEPGETWTDDAPITRWRLENILLGDLKLGHFAYDPELVRDDAGDLYLLYCSGAPNEVTLVDIHIKARRLLDPATLDPAFAPRTLLSPEGLRSEDRNPGFVQILEGPRLRRFGGQWALLYSAGDFGGCNYKLGVAWSGSLIPPQGKQYRKLYMPDPKNLWENNPGGGATPEKGGPPGATQTGGEGANREIDWLLQSQHAAWPNFIGDLVCGPGHANLVPVNGRQILVFHGRQHKSGKQPSQGRFVWTLPVEVDVNPNRPMPQWIQPALPRSLPDQTN